MKILAIGAHFDDLELGCGGSLIRWAREGHDVVGLILTDSGYRDEKGALVRDSAKALQEGQLAAKLAGYRLLTGPFMTFQLSDGSKLNEFILGVINSEKPDVLLTHWRHDTHSDHRAVAVASLHCARRVPRVLMYRSNWYVGGVPYNGNFFVDISEDFETKLETLKIYESELSRSSGQWLEWVDHCSREAGLVSGTRRAEAFEVVKWMW